MIIHCLENIDLLSSSYISGEVYHVDGRARVGECASFLVVMVGDVGLLSPKYLSKDGIVMR